DESSRPILLRFALDRWCRGILALEPVPRPAGAVGRAKALEHNAFEPELASVAYGLTVDDAGARAGEPSTTLADLFTLLFAANPFSAARASLRRWSSDEFEDGLAHGGRCRSRRRPVDSFFPALLF